MYVVYEKMNYCLGVEHLTCQRYNIFKWAVASNTAGWKRQCHEHEAKQHLSSSSGKWGLDINCFFHWKLVISDVDLLCQYLDIVQLLISNADINRYMMVARLLTHFKQTIAGCSEKETMSLLRVYSPPRHVAKLDGDPEDSGGVGTDGCLKVETQQNYFLPR